MKAETNDLVRAIITQTNKDVIPWERLGDGKFASFDEKYPFAVEQIRGLPVLMTNSTFESFLSRSLVVKDLWNSIKKYLERRELDAEFSSLIKSYARP